MNYSTERKEFNGSAIEVLSATENNTIEVSEMISDLDGFHGATAVDHVVHFGQMFESLIGTYDGQWNSDSNVEEGIVVLEEHFDEARKLMDAIGVLASKIIENEELYQDTGIAQEYYDLTMEGYRLLRKHEEHFGMSPLADTTLVSLERGGLVSTRAALGVDPNAVVENEYRVVTKRTHFTGQPDTALSVTVLWRDRDGLSGAIDKKELAICDFVNPASGASVDAFVLAATVLGHTPSALHNRSITGTQAGICFAQEAMKSVGINTSFYSVGVCDTMNDHYYLMGNRAVGDAGHILRHFLPEA